MKKKEESNIFFVSVRLVKDAPVMSEKRIEGAEDAIEVMGDLLREMDREAVAVINLKSDGTPINFHIASMGSINGSLVTSREIFKAAVLSNAANVIVMHCHPSGSLLPSKDDIMISDKLIHAGELMGIPVIDHIIIGAGKTSFFSFKESGMMELPNYRWNKSCDELEFAKPKGSGCKEDSKKTKRRTQEER